jgi:phosphoenolpyruvate carboxykinase (ATP)
MPLPLRTLAVAIAIAIDEDIFMANHERAVDYLNICPQMFIVDGYAGWDLDHRIEVRFVCSRAYHGTRLCRRTPSRFHAQRAQFDVPLFSHLTV